MHANSLGSTWGPWGAACSPGTAEANKTYLRHTTLLSAVSLAHASLQKFLGRAVSSPVPGGAGLRSPVGPVGSGLRLERRPQQATFVYEFPGVAVSIFQDWEPLT